MEKEINKILLTINGFLYILSIEDEKMKDIIYILIFITLSFGASQSSQFDGALDWYGYNSLLSTDLYTENHMDDDGEDGLFRKRRHRRRRKIGPSKKGW